MNKPPAAPVPSTARAAKTPHARRPRIYRAMLMYTLASAAALAVATLALATWASLRDFPQDLGALTGSAIKSQVLARDGTPLSYTLENAWNTTDAVPLAVVFHAFSSV